MKVLSIEQMTKLKELGVDTSKASLHYVYLPTARSIFNETDELESEPTLFACNPEMLDGYPTFALQDVVELLPCEIFTSRSNFYLNITKFDGNSYTISYEIQLQDGSIEEIILQADDILECSYNMLIWVIENGHLKKKLC